MKSFDKQIGGSHYKDFPIQPTEFIERNGLSFLEGCIIKRVCRYKTKNKKEDLEKAIHELQQLIDLNYPEEHSSYYYDYDRNKPIKGVT